MEVGDGSIRCIVDVLKQHGVDQHWRTEVREMACGGQYNVHRVLDGGRHVGPDGGRNGDVRPTLQDDAGYRDSRQDVLEIHQENGLARRQRYVRAHCEQAAGEPSHCDVVGLFYGQGCRSGHPALVVVLDVVKEFSELLALETARVAGGGVVDVARRGSEQDQRPEQIGPLRAG
jgi:hypothetical protein